MRSEQSDLPKSKRQRGLAGGLNNTHQRDRGPLADILKHKVGSLRCPLKAQCTTGDYRRIARWEHEAVLDAMQDRLDRQPEMMRVRRQTVEHPFGTIKHWMGWTHFLTKTLARVRTEMSLHVLAYNLKRVMRILGIEELMRAMMLKSA